MAYPKESQIARRQAHSTRRRRRNGARWRRSKCMRRFEPVQRDDFFSTEQKVHCVATFLEISQGSRIETVDAKKNAES
ncbi:MAG: hypothetical protein WCA56_15745, partial [Xanthobacteraceae bacterium]